MRRHTIQASETHDDAAMASSLFENSGKNGHFWHDLSTGCSYVRRLVEKNARLTTSQYQVLLGALALSSYALRAHPDFRPGAPDIASLAEGYEALAGLVHHLAETDEKRASRHPDVIRDMKDWSRILQNIAHNRSLIDQIAQRAHQRHVAAVDNIKHVATGSGSGGGERR